FYLFSPVDHYSLTNTDGANSAAQLVLSGNRLYGTTAYGGHHKSGSFANGTVFAINTDGTGFTNLYNFSATVANPSGFFTNSDGANPSAGLVLSGNTLYGRLQREAVRHLAPYLPFIPMARVLQTCIVSIPPMATGPGRSPV